MINREWIAVELAKGIDAEQTLSHDAKARADAPPDPELAVLYHEIAAADERHRGIVDAVATRYGHVPTPASAGGIGETIGRLKDRVADTVMTPHPMDRLAHDIAAKANAIHWYVAWIHAFEAIGDAESARELSSNLTEEKAHRDALQEGLNRMVKRGAQSEPEAKK